MNTLQLQAQMYLDAGHPVPLDLVVGLVDQGCMVDEYLDKLDGYQVVDPDAFIEGCLTYD